MQIPKEQVLEFLRSRGQQDKAQQADQELPGQVDTDRHSNILERLGINPQELTGQLGDIAGKLGL
jgi:hypothetical protein